MTRIGVGVYRWICYECGKEFFSNAPRDSLILPKCAECRKKKKENEEDV